MSNIFFAIFVRIEFFQFQGAFLGEFDDVIRKLCHLRHVNSKRTRRARRPSSPSLRLPEALIADARFQFVEKDERIVDGQSVDMEILNHTGMFEFDRCQFVKVRGE